MSILYKPVKIETAEQAESYPLGTVATASFDYSRERSVDGWAESEEGRAYGPDEMIGFVAFVPVKAVAETVSPDAVTYVRHVTAWEEA